MDYDEMKTDMLRNIQNSRFLKKSSIDIANDYSDTFLALDVIGDIERCGYARSEDSNMGIGEKQFTGLTEKGINYLKEK